MSFESLSQSQQQTRDSIGSNPAVIPIPKINKDTLTQWAGPIVIYDRDIDNSWIVGSSTNAIVGTWTGTAGGGQLIVGATTNTEALLRVSPANGQYVNFLRDTTENTSDASDIGLLDNSATTATINTSTFRIDWGVDEVVVWRISYNDGVVSTATVLFNEDSERTDIDFSTDVTIEVSANGGTNWTTCTNKVQQALTHSGQDVLLRVTCGSSAKYWKTTNDDGDERPIIVRLQ